MVQTAIGSIIDLTQVQLMHELSVTENILEIALNHAEKAKAAKISDLYLVLGDLSSILDDSVQFYWDMLAEGTKAEGARLHFRRLPVKIICKSCSHTYTPQAGNMACPECRSDQIQIIQGEEFYLEAIDIEKEDQS